MIKRFLAVLLSAACVMSLATGCGKKESKEVTNTESNVETNAEESKSEEKGKVYYLNFKPESDAAWQILAEQYTAETGVEVKVVTAAGGEYESTLSAEMSKSSAPTMFQVGNQNALATWQDYCLDLTGTDVFNEMTTEDFNIKGNDGGTYAIGYCYEAFGLITNKALLEKAGYKVEDIKDFASLKAVAEDITARKDELGFSAFSSAGLDSSSSWRFSGHLTNLPLFYEFRDNNVTSQPAEVTGAYLDNYKAIWDLYINNSTVDPVALATATGDQSEAEFGKGEAVFFQNGTWEYANLVTSEEKGFLMKAEDLTMIPIYSGVEGEENSGLNCGTENCWAVNSKASEADQKATLDFMKWIVTSEAGTKMMADQFGPIPFKSAKESENVFFTAANKYINDGKYVVTWAFNYTPNVETWRTGVVSALTQYSANGGDWENVKTAYVNGWAAQYKNQ